MPKIPLHTYLLIWSPAKIQREVVKEYVDQAVEIVNWKAVWALYPNAMFIVTSLSADKLAEVLEPLSDQYADSALFFTQVDNDKTNGWADFELWHFINEPTVADEEDDNADRESPPNS